VRRTRTRLRAWRDPCAEASCTVSAPRSDHTHYHCCILDAVLAPRDDGSIRFLPAAAPTPQEITAIAEQVRHRVLRWLARSGLLAADDARDMLGWDNGGFSLDASVGIAGQDRAGLERLLRYCARPPFALERLEQVNEQHIIYQLPKPRRDGRTVLMLTPLELIAHLAGLIPPPCRHRHRYHGVPAPNSPLRAAATACGFTKYGVLTLPWIRRRHYGSSILSGCRLRSASIRQTDL
jgi:hypothetical protein